MAEARKKRMEYSALLSNNIDPKEHRDEEEYKRKEAMTNTLKAVTERWLQVKKAKVTSDHANYAYRSLEIHVFPQLGEFPVSKLRAKQVIKTLKPLEARGSLETVKRVCQRLNEVMTFAVNTGVTEFNPLAGIKEAFHNPEAAHMPTIPADRLPELMNTIKTASIKLATRYLIEWQLHTITRPGEACRARWSEIDWQKKLWCIPAETMKKKRDHTIPLTPQSLVILESMKPISSHCEYVFASERNNRTHMSASTANTALKRMGYHGVLVAHGFRSIASTLLNEQGFDPDVIEAALSHVGENKVRRAYNRTDYLQRRAPLMCWWSNYIEEAATGNQIAAGREHLSLVNTQPERIEAS
ncbi:MAG: tyrosine-type recombinase/integrase [Endozoicomonadaceae bacterium]|nr:tyrosine-type recombinase/integrase [Endozoicomonadaceae bacterium]